MSRTRASHALPTVLLLTSLMVAAPGRGSPPAELSGLPQSVAVLGDSMTTAALSSKLERNQWENSWATGDNPLVQSHALRIRTALPSGLSAEARAFNAAVSGQR